MSIVDTSLAAIAFVLIKAFFERENYKEKPLKLTFFLLIEVIVFAILFYFASKLFD